jgi:fibronectin-binding autotransporter adhesin
MSLRYCLDARARKRKRSGRYRRFHARLSLTTAAVTLLTLPALLTPAGAATFIWKGSGSTSVPTSGNFNVATNWNGGIPTSATATELDFNGSGSTPYTATNDLSNFAFGIIKLNSTATVTENIAGNAFNESNTDQTVQQDGSGAFSISNGFSYDNANLTLTGNGAGLVTITGIIGEKNNSSGHDATLVKSGSSTFQLNGSNNISGGTSITGGTLIVGNANGLGSGAVTLTNAGITITNAATFGSGTVLAGKGTYTPTASLFSVGSGVHVSPGINDVGTLAIGKSTTFAAGSIFDVGLSGASGDQLNVTGTLDTSAASNTLAITGTATGGLYTLAHATVGLTVGSHTAANGGFASVTGLDTANYHLNTTATDIQMIHKATIGTITATGQVITGGSGAFSFTVQNSAPSLSDALAATFAAGTNVTGSVSGTSINANSTSGALTGFGFNSAGLGVGAGKTGTFTVTGGVNTTNSAQTGTVTVDVFDHASGSVSSTTLTIPDVIVGYASPIAGNSLNVSNASGFRVNLKSTNNGPVNSVSLINASAVAPGGSGAVSASLVTGKAAGAYSQAVTLTYADDSALGGASSSLGTQAITVTGNVYNHASGAISGGSTLTVPDVFVGYGSPVASSNSLTFNNASGFRVNLKSTNDGPQNSLSIGNLSAVAPGAGQTIAGSLATGKGVGAYSQALTLTYADDSALTGASSNVGTQAVTLTGNVFDHASGSVSSTTLTVPDVFVGYASPVASNSLNVNNAAGFRVNLKTTNNGPVNSISLGNASAVAAGGSGAVSATLATGKGVGSYSQGLTLTYADDSAISGANSNLGTQAITVTGNVFDHASGAISGGSTLTVPDVIVGYGSPVASSNLLTFNNASGFRVNLKSTNSGPQNSLSIGNLSAVAPGANQTVAGSLATGKGIGSYSQGLTLTYADDSAISGASSNLGTQAVTLTGNVFDHASGSVSGSALTIPDVIVGYGSSVGSNSVNVSNASGFRVNLKTTNSGPVNSISLGNVAGVAAGGSGAVSATLATGKGVGTYSQGLTLTYADDSALGGASANDGTQAFTVTGNVFDHASGSLVGGSTLTIPDTIVGYSSPIASSNSLTFNNAAGLRVGLKSTNDGPLNSLSIGNLSGVAAGGSQTVAGLLATGKGVGSYSQNFTLTYGDDSALAGASSNLGTQSVTVTGNIVGHATPGTLVTGNGSFSGLTAIVGATGVGANVNLANGGGSVASLQVNATPTIGSGSVTNPGALLLGPGASQNYTATFDVGGSAGSFTNNVTFTAGDNQALTGASALGPVVAGINYTVVDHASPSLSSASVDFGKYFTGAVVPGVNVDLHNASGSRANLVLTGVLGTDDTATLTRTGGSTGSIVAGGNLASSFGLNTGTSGHYSAGYAFDVEDQPIPGATDLPTQNLSVTGDVYETASVSHGNGSFTNAAPLGGQRSDAVFNSVTFDGGATTQGFFTAHTGTAIAGGPAFHAVTFDPTHALNGTHNATFFVDAHNDMAIHGAALGDVLDNESFENSVDVTGQEGLAAAYSAHLLGGESYAGYSLDSGTEDGALNTRAEFLSGVTGGDRDVSITFSSAADTNIDPYSDVAFITGTGSDVFTLQMSYDPALATPGAPIWIVYEQTDGHWVTAVTGNDGGVITYLGDTPWLADYGLGSYGYDDVTDPLHPVAWAVLNFSGARFAVVPEPGVASSLSLVGAVIVMTRRRRRA